MDTIKVNITKLEETDMFYLELISGTSTIEGKYERSDLRHLIGTIDNAI